MDRKPQKFERMNTFQNLQLLRMTPPSRNYQGNSASGNRNMYAGRVKRAITKNTNRQEDTIEECSVPGTSTGASIRYEFQEPLRSQREVIQMVQRPITPSYQSYRLPSNNNLYVQHEASIYQTPTQSTGAIRRPQSITNSELKPHKSEWSMSTVKLDMSDLSDTLQGSNTIVNESQIRNQYRSSVKLGHPWSRVWQNSAWQDRNSQIADQKEKLDQQKMREYCPLPKYFDTFILADLVAKGCFANVYKAFDKSTNSVIAIKSYRIKMRRTNYYSRVATEIVYLKILTHPHIISYICSDIKKQYTYIGMEYSGYGCLRNFMSKRAVLTEQIVQHVMRQLSSAVYYLQTMRVFHGDIKPDNIIVTKAERFLTIKLTDFGLSEISMINGENGQKKSGSFFYMAPELHLGFPTDCKSDLFSVGVVMYELIYGIKPFPTNITSEEYIANFKKRMEIVFPMYETHLLTECCVDLVKNLLSYDKWRRLSGLDLLNHPFLKIDPIDDEKDHYYEAYQSFLRGADLLAQSKYGQAYVEITTAILHLQIQSTRITDMGLYKCISLKIQKYKTYCVMLEESIVNESLEPIYLSTDTERLRCLLQSSPELLSAFDSCIVGEMYFWFKHVEYGADLIKKGIDILTSNMKREPEGQRKNLLTNRMAQWRNILQKVQSEHLGISDNLDIRGM